MPGRQERKPRRRRLASGLLWATSVSLSGFLSGSPDFRTGTPIETIDYLLVSGKPGAMERSVHLSCTTGGSESSYGDSSTAYPTEATQRLCQMAEIQDLCQDYQGQEEGVFDAATFEIRCALDTGGETRWRWIGQLREAPGALKSWHNAAAPYLE